MAVRMGKGVYLSAWRAAGRSTAPPRPLPYVLTRGIPIDLPSAGNAVYIACASSTIRYVGSTTRGVTVRVREHVRDGRGYWEELWVISLVEEVSPYGVLLAEERVAKELEPTDNIRPAGR